MQVQLRKWGLTTFQLTLGALALLAVAFAPPAQGRMLLVPLDGEPVRVAALGGMRVTPLLAGPLPGSLVVEGERGPMSALWSQGVLVLAAPEAICGGQESRG
jgi:hypothetical protein